MCEKVKTREISPEIPCCCGHWITMSVSSIWFSPVTG